MMMFKVIKGTNRKLVYQFLLVNNANLHLILHYFHVIACYC